MGIKLLMSSGNIYNSDTNCSSATSVVSSASGATTRSLPPKKRSIDKSDTNCSSATSVTSASGAAATRSLPPKKRRFVHCTNDFSPSMDCFDHHDYAFSTSSPPKTAYKPTVAAAAAANTNEAFAQHNVADALSSLFGNSRSAMETGDLLVSLGRCAKAPKQVISTSNTYSSNNAASSKQQSPNLDYSVAFAQSATLALEQLQSSHALAQSSPYVAAKVALWNAYLKARAQL